MSMIPFWSPFEEMRRLESEVSDLFRSFQTRKREGFYPLPIDLVESPEEYSLKAHLPGFNNDEIQVEVTSQFIEIRAEKEEEKTEENENMILNEISSVKYRRRISLDQPINTSEVKTTLKNGVLDVQLPKSEEAKSVKLIPEAVE